MKKPLILLIDDEPAVLEALEAVLAPAFEEICRIEAFDDARAVLEAMPAWAQEGRPIAVAIVDQKMPGIAGTELVASLRAWQAAGGSPFAAAEAACGTPTGRRQEKERTATTPASWMKVVLLTGHAGLDSALKAINEAGVDRYVEKPWKENDLVAQVRGLVRLHLRDSGNDVHFVFREITAAGELREHLALRYQVFRLASHTETFLPETGPGLDMDRYDRFSRFFGLFSEGGDENRMVGTLRLTGAERGHASGALEEVAAQFPLLSRRLHEEVVEPLPLLMYLLDRDVVRALYDRLIGEGEKVVEPGRLTLHPVFRSCARTWAAGGGGGGDRGQPASSPRDAGTVSRLRVPCARQRERAPGLRSAA